MNTIQEQLGAEALGRLHGMELRARTMVEGHFSGQHHSHFKGASVEFADHRNYSSGDDLRHLDWKLLGRTDRHFIKQYDAETNMNVLLVADVSGSMGYGSGGANGVAPSGRSYTGTPEEGGGVTKFQYATYLAAGLAYLTSKQGDAPGLALVDERLRERLAPRTRPAHLKRLMQSLEEAQPGGDTSLADALAETAAAFTRRGIVVLISDLLDEPERLLRALVYFRHRGHDVIVLHVLDPAEVSFSFRGPVIFEDLEDGEKLLTEADDIRKAYLQEFGAWQGGLEDGCRWAGLDYALMSTAEPFHRALSAYLGRRARVTR